MSMMNSGRSRRDFMAASMSARVMIGAAEPVAVTTISEQVSSSVMFSHGTASPSIFAASAGGVRRGPIGHPDAAHLLRPKMGGGELGHFPRADEESSEPC